jgi:hypothetical protein
MARMKSSNIEKHRNAGSRARRAERCSAGTAEGGRADKSSACPETVLLIRSGDGGKRRGTSGVGVAVVDAAVNWMRLRQQRGGLNCDPEATSRTDLGPLRNRYGPTTIVAAAIEVIELGVMGSGANHGLPHAASVRSRGRNRQSRRGEHAHKQQYHEHSGGQAVHSGSGRPHTCLYRLASRG